MLIKMTLINFTHCIIPNHISSHPYLLIIIIHTILYIYLLFLLDLFHKFKINKNQFDANIKFII